MDLRKLDMIMFLKLQKLQVPASVFGKANLNRNSQTDPDVGSLLLKPSVHCGTYGVEKKCEEK